MFPRSHSAAKDLLALADPLVPVAKDIAATASSFDKGGGIEDVMRFIYYYTGAVNGEDSLGHYVRTLLQIGSCSPRTPSPVPGCQATFNALSTGGGSNALRATAGRTLHAAAPDSIVSEALKAVGSDRALTAVRPLASYLFGR